MNEQDYKEYQDLINEGHSQRSAAKILGIDLGNGKTAKSKLYYEGRVFPTRGFGDIVVLEYICGQKVLVKFLKSGYETITSTSHIKQGSIKDKLSPTVRGVGILGDVTERLQGVDFTAYRAWVMMLDRCYSDIAQNKRPTYKDCTVSENFKYFQFFLKWCNNQIGFGNEGWQLDKDILVKGNKIYSPETCCFVPPEINGLFIKSNNTRGNNPLGVSFQKSLKKFSSYIRIKGKRHTIGYYNTPEEAFYAYKQAKEAYIKEVANKWKDQIDIKVYEALMNYEVEITD